MTPFKAKMTEVANAVRCNAQKTKEGILLNNYLHERC